MKIKIRRTNNILKRIGKKTLVALATFILVILPVTLLILFNSPKGVEAAWANEDWGYRYPITITNSTGSAQTNLQKLLTIDTSTLVTAGKLQSDCDDLRFTAQNGTVLPYYIDSGCNTTTTKVWVLIDNLPTNGSVIYMYYGNPSASIGSNPREFDNLVGLVGYWTMNDTSGSTATDSSVNANNGTATGTTIATGQVGNTRSFNGTSDYVAISDSNSLDITSNLTVSLWLKTTTTGNLVILEKSNNNTNYAMHMSNVTGGQVQFNISATAGTGRVESNYAVNDDTWHHVVGTFDDSANTLKIYIDGILRNTNSNVTDTLTANVQNLLIGSRSGSFSFPGSIDDVHIYNTARTADQISSDYTKTYTIQTSPLTVTTANGSEEKAPSPVAYWKFDDGTGTTAQDSTTNNNDGTLTNGPTWQTEDMCVSGKCLKFDGTDDYVDLGTSSTLNPTGGMTISAWIKANTLTGAHWVVSKDDASLGRAYSLGPSSDSSNKLELQINGNATIRNQGEVLVAGKWYHIVATGDPSSGWKTYVNGTLQGTASWIAPNTTTGNVNIGRRTYTGSQGYFKGFIDEPKIYNYARSADQIKADYANRGGLEGSSSVIASATNGARGNLSDGLVGYWKMDESSWTNNCTATSVTDSSGNGNNGKSCPNTTGPTGGASGKFGNAGSFDGTNDYVQMAASTSLNVTNNITMGFWIKTSTTTGQIIIGGYDANSPYAGYGVSIGQTAAGKIGYWSGSHGSWVGANSTVNDNSWHHIVISVSGTTVTFYKDGILDGTQTSAVPNSYSGSRAIGAVSDGLGGFFSGTLDEARIYNRSLSPAEVSKLYNFAPGPVAHYNFDENTGTTVNDRSGNANTGTWNGSGSPKWKPGKYGTAGNFDGSTDYVDIGNPSILSNLSMGTISGWFYVNDLSSIRSIFSYSNGTSTEILNPSILTDGSFNVQLKTGNADILLFYTPAGTIQTNRWYHFAFTVSSTGNALYLDGKPASVTYTVGNASTSKFFSHVSGNTNRIGRLVTNYDRYFSGQIDDVKIYNYARTQQQIVEDMTNGSDVGGSGYVSANSSTGGSIAKPVGYWKFDEGYGTTANNVGNGGTALNGTLTNMASPATSTSGWTQSGKVNKALVFDGTNDYVTIAANSIFNFRTNSFSYGAWAKATSLPSGGSTATIFDRGTSTNPVLTLYINNIGQVTCGLRGANQNFITATSTQTISANTWYHFMCVRDINSGNLYTYVNGVQWASSSDTTGALDLSSFYLEIGGSNGTSSIWIGQIDEAKLYLYALTADQIKMDMNQGSAQVVGNLGTNSSYPSNSSNQEYCVPGDSTSCAAPVGRWDFDEATGTTANDSSGNNNTGTLTNGPTWKPGKVNKSLNFDGSDDYVSAADSANLQLATSLTLEAWFNTTSTSTNNRCIVRKDTSSGTRYLYDLNISNTTLGKVDASYLNSTSNFKVTSTQTYNDGKWHHAVSTINGTTLSLYIDGVLQGTTTISGTQGVPNGPVYIGTCAPATFNYSGQIDQVRIFNYARTAAQVAWDYNKGAPVGHWRMDECQGTTVNDASGNSNTGTITIGASGTQTSAGTCTDGSSTSAWYNGRTGKKNYSLNFDGTDDYISVADASTLDITPHITIAAWINSGSTLNNYESIVGKRDAGATETNYALRTGQLSNNDELEFYWANGGAWQVYTTNNANLSTSTWYHIVAIYDGSTVKIYKNGIILAGTCTSGTCNNALVSDNNSVGIGRHGDFNNDYFSGQIDDVRVYNYALTATQVKNLMNEGAYRSGPNTGAP